MSAPPVVASLDVSAAPAQQPSDVQVPPGDRLRLREQSGAAGAAASIHMQRVEDPAGAPDLLVVERQRESSVNFYVESRDGSTSRRLHFTPEQQAVLEQQFRELVAAYPGADIEFDVTHQRLYVRSPGREAPQVFLIHEESPGAAGLVNALCEYKRTELFVSHIASYSRSEKGNLRAPRALLPHSSMSERLQRLNRQDFAAFQEQYEPYFDSLRASGPGTDAERTRARDRTREKLARAARFHIAYKEILDEEIKKLQGEIRALPPGAASDRMVAYKQGTIQRLQNLLERISSIDIFATGWAISDPAFDVFGAPLPTATLVQNAERCRTGLEDFLREQEGNSVASTHDDYWFASLRGRIPDLTSVERDYAQDIVAMTLGDRFSYEAFMGERGSRRDSLEELLLLNYANHRRDCFRRLPSTGDADLNEHIRSRLFRRLQEEERAAASRPATTPVPTSAPAASPALTPAPVTTPAPSAAAAATPPLGDNESLVSDDGDDVFHDSAESPTPSAPVVQSPPLPPPAPSAAAAASGDNSLSNILLV